MSSLVDDCSSTAYTESFSSLWIVSSAYSCGDSQREQPDFGVASLGGGTEHTFDDVDAGQRMITCSAEPCVASLRQRQGFAGATADRCPAQEGRRPAPEPD
jgi:hypothetical protein